MGEKVLIALGGNALSKAGGKGNIDEQLVAVEETCKLAYDLIKVHHTIAITHGNGPQVGSILLKDDIAKEKIPPNPLDICGAETQGMIGYMLQRTMYNLLLKNNMDFPVVTMVSQTLVDKNDEAFKNPTKPVGPFYTKEESEKISNEKGWQMVEQVGKGYRRVVPSPKPIDIIEGKAIKNLFDKEWVVIACGGGGIPVIKEDDGTLTGIEGVIDKDRTAAVLGKVIGVDVLVIVTDVDKVSINFHKPNQEDLSELTLLDAKKYLDEGQFGKGSMGPKVEAACQFIKDGGKKAIITSLGKCKDALDGKTGTHFKA
jgi:carbamate kinase